MTDVKPSTISGVLHSAVWGPNYPAKFCAYVDEAGHSKDPRRTHFGLGGLIALESDWKNFDEEWRSVCTEERISLPFHMRDLAGFRGQFDGWTEEQRRRAIRKLIQAIRNAHAIPIGSVVSVSDFNAFSPKLRENLRDPYFMAFQPLTYNLAVCASMAEPMPGPAAMVFAHQPEHSDGLTNARDLWLGLRKYNPIVANFMYSYDCLEQIDKTPLQAADLWAYELVHHFEVIRPARMEARWPFKQFVQMGLNYDFTHNFITYSDANGENGIGRMARAQKVDEVSLYSPGMVDRGGSRIREMLRRLETAVKPGRPKPNAS